MIDKHHFISKKGVMALTFSAALCASMTAQAETIEVKKFKYAGPFPVSLPWMADSVDIKGEKFAMENCWIPRCRLLPSIRGKRFLPYLPHHLRMP